MPDITIKQEIVDKFTDLQNQDRKTVRKLNALLRELSRNPQAGLGKVEKLKGRPDTYSRRLDQHNRLVYEFKTERSPYWTS